MITYAFAFLIVFKEPSTLFGYIVIVLFVMFLIVTFMVLVVPGTNWFRAEMPIFSEYSFAVKISLVAMMSFEGYINISFSCSGLMIIFSLDFADASFPLFFDVVFTLANGLLWVSLKVVSEVESLYVIIDEISS